MPCDFRLFISDMWFLLCDFKWQIYRLSNRYLPWSCQPSMSPTRFTLILPTHVKQAELICSWNSYACCYPMYMAAQSLTSTIWYIYLKFPGTGFTAITQSWYYYLLDGCFILKSHKPNFGKVMSTASSIYVFNNIDLNTSYFTPPTCNTPNVSQDQLRTPIHITHSLSKNIVDHERTPIVMPQPNKPFLRTSVCSYSYYNISGSTHMN